MEMSKVQSIIDKWNGDPDFAIEMLQDIQTEYHHIPKEVISEISRCTGIPKTRLFFIATFYNAFSLTPRGEHEIHVCTGTTCHVKGAKPVVEAIERELSITEGETSSDLKYTLESVHCLGCCSLAPVVSVNGKVHGGIKSSKVKRIIPELKDMEGGEDE
jgi:NADH-quinone oxidoreductase subunit E